MYDKVIVLCMYFAWVYIALCVSEMTVVPFTDCLGKELQILISCRVNLSDQHDVNLLIIL